MVKPEDWKKVAMPNETEDFTSGRNLRPDEFSKLIMGLKPSSMDDKWFVYWLNQSIYFHRSWSGHCIYIAKVEKENNEILLTEVTTNKNLNQFGIQDIALKKEMFNKLVDLVLRQ